MMTPEEKRRHYGTESVIYMAVRLSEALTAVQVRADSLERMLRAAAERGMPRAEAEAVTRALDGIDVKAMIDRAYAAPSPATVTRKDPG